LARRLGGTSRSRWRGVTPGFTAAPRPRGRREVMVKIVEGHIVSICYVPLVKLEISDAL